MAPESPKTAHKRAPGGLQSRCLWFAWGAWRVSALLQGSTPTTASKPLAWSPRRPKKASS
eukprot:6272030-Pyramimonas_sp.AAC.1